MIFQVAKNCKLTGEVMSLEQVNSLLDSQGGLIDFRHNIYSVENTNDLTEYLNYIDTVRDIAQKAKTPAGGHAYMLKLGYIPVVMPPFFMLDSIQEMVVPALESYNIPYVKLSATSFIDPKYSHPVNDIWVSKLDVCELLNCNPENVTVRKLLEVIL